MPHDLTRITLGELISNPDTIVQRHAHGIVKRLRGRWSDEGRRAILAFGEQHPDFMDAWREDKRLHPEKYSKK